MTKLTASVTAVLAIALAAAMPFSADAQRHRGGGGGGGHATPHVGGGGGGARPFHGAPAGRAVVHSAPMQRNIGRSFVQHRAIHRAAVPHFHRGATASSMNPINRATRRRQATIHSLRQQHTVGRQRTQHNVQAQHRLRRDGAVTAQRARQGRFATRFAQHVGNGRLDGRRTHWAARRAWRRGLRAGFVPWYGPVFWPYAYSDIFDYTFWPYGYDNGYWDYAYDDFFDGVFWGEVGPPDAYGYGYPPSAAPRVRHAVVQELCSQPGTGITAWPFAQIESKVGLNVEQKQMLGDVRDAAKQAAAEFKDSCPAQRAFPRTPPGRLDAMKSRYAATLQAVETVRPPLEKFYNSLSDEQKERFNELGPKAPKNTADAARASADEANSCKQPKASLSNLPIEKIGNVVKPTSAQEGALKQLQGATGKAVSILQQACPDETPLTPPGRLAAMETRLKALIDAANTVKPPLDNFYFSLSNEQKARFNRIGRAAPND